LAQVLWLKPGLEVLLPASCESVSCRRLNCCLASNPVCRDLRARTQSTMLKLLGFLTLVGASALKVDISDGERPIAKVVNLLKDMGDQLQHEAEADEEAFSKFACWCETNDKEKSKAIKDGTQHIADLTAAIEEYASGSQRLTSEIAALKVQVEQQTNSLNEATAIREKEAAEFHAEEKDMINSITSLKGAVVTLGKAHGEGPNALMQVQKLLQHPRYEQMFAQILTRRQRKVVLSLVQTDSKATTPASGEIFGILKQMKETFETNRANSQKDEAQAGSEYAQLKEAKTSELAAARDQIEAKTVNLADSDQKGAQATQDKADTENAVEADNAFLADIRPKCATADADYQARVKVRTEEIQAVSETIGILTNDEANDAFTKSMSFIQKSSTVKLQARARAVTLLTSASKKNPKLVTLAVSMQLDAFSKVNANIDSMVEALKKEQGDEVGDRDFCIKELNTNERQAAERQDTRADLEQKIADLTSEIESLTDSLKTLAAEVTDAQIQMKKASENRAEENKDFQMTVSDQRATQAILAKALDRLNDFYAKRAAFLQANGIAPVDDNAPPPTGVAYAKNAGGGGVIAMIQEVVTESKDLETKAIAAENDSQAAYEGFIKDTNKLISANNKDIANKSDAKAKADMSKAQAEGDLKATITDILSLDEMAKQLHDQCDFLLKNFDERQSSRSQEMDALRQAKAIFSGMK